MDKLHITNKNLFFTPVNLDKVTEEIIEVAVFARNFFDQDLGVHPYFIEQECYAKYEGDFAEHAFNFKAIGHSPSPQMLRYGGNGQDKIATTFTLGKPINNGSLTWKIPMYIFDMAFDGNGDIRKNKILLDEKKPKVLDPVYLEYPEVDFEAMKKQYKLVAQIEIVQRFVLENSILTMSKNGIDLLRLDLKQYPYIFK